MKELIEELKRRNVIRVGAAYVMAAWVILQFADLVLENLGAPDWIMRGIMLLLAAGLPLAVFLAWAFEFTPDGLKSERDVDRDSATAPQSAKFLDRAIIGILLLALILIVAERVFLAGTSLVESAGEGAAAAAKSIAVLPLADLSESQDQEWFADGLAEEILNALARTPDLLVSSRTSAFAYKGTAKDAPTIARELGVNHVLEGSVRKSGARLRVTAQLIRASDGFHVWSQIYDRSTADVIDIQEDLALRIARALETSMDEDALQDMLRVGTRSVEAYQEYLRGLSAIARAYAGYRANYFLESYEHFENARTIDPRFHEAHRRAATFWAIQLSPMQTMAGLTDTSARQQFDAFAERIDQAIETARNDADRDSTMAQKARVETRVNDAIRLQQRYLAARPGDLLGWKDLGDMAAYAWDKPASDAAIDRMRTLGMTDATAAQFTVNASFNYRFDHSAADYGLKALERWPGNLGIAYQTHRALLWEGRVEEAAGLAGVFDRQNRQYRLISARQACAEGRRDEALALLRKRPGAGARPDPNDWLLHMMLGDPTSAIEVIRAYEVPGMPYPIMSWLVYPHFDPGPFPSLVEYIERENVPRPPPVRLPYACPAA